MDYLVYSLGSTIYSFRKCCYSTMHISAPGHIYIYLFFQYSDNITDTASRVLFSYMPNLPRHQLTGNAFMTKDDCRLGRVSPEATKCHILANSGDMLHRYSCFIVNSSESISNLGARPPLDIICLCIWYNYQELWQYSWWSHDVQKQGSY